MNIINKAMRNLSMLKKIQMPTGFSIMFLIITGIFLSTGFIKLKIAVDEIIDVRFKVYRVSSEINRDLTSVHGNLYKAFMWKSTEYDSSKITKIVEEQMTVLVQTNKSLNSIMNSKMLSNVEMQLIMDIFKGVEEYQINAMTATDSLNVDTASATMLMGMCDDQFILLNENLQKLMSLQNNLNDKSHDIIRRNFRTFLSIAFFLIVSSIVVSIILSLTLSKFIVTPIKKTTLLLKGISEEDGDLTRKLEVETRDEIGAMSDYFNKFVSKIGFVVKDVKETAILLATSSEQMSATANTFASNAQGQAANSEEITASIEEISSGINNIADDSSDQIKKVDSLSNNLETLSVIIKDMDNLIKETVGLSKDMYVDAKSREESLRNMDESMQNINKSSGEMTNIVNIINDISDQINLLSLNAAIEAARAGDSGRGFAVVSDEISKLADQTAQSIKDIGALIRINENEIARGLENVEATVSTISRVISGVNSITTKMSTIAEKMSDEVNINSIVTTEAQAVKDRSNAIQYALTEQKLAMEEIMRSISSISELTQANAAGAEEMAATSANVAELTVKLKDRSDYFKI